MSTATQLRPVLTTQGNRYTVAAIVVQESPDGADSADLTALATRLADEARRLLQEERPGVDVSAAIALSGPEPVTLESVDTPAPTDADPAPAAEPQVQVDRRSYRASVDGRVIGLSFREFELLAYLVDHPGRVFTRRQLVDVVWNGAAVGDRTVDVHVRRLRVKLGAAADRLTTIRNVGYRFEPAARALETVA